MRVPDYEGLGAEPGTTMMSPITGNLIPVFDVTLTHGRMSITTKAGFDTGNMASACSIPLEMVARLGLSARYPRTIRTPSGIENSYDSVIDKISIPGKPDCFMENATVILGGVNTPLIGSSFLDAVGATIDYSQGAPKFNCTRSGKGDTSGYVFPFTIVQKGEAFNMDLLVDTGGEFGFIIPASDLPSGFKSNPTTPIITSSGTMTKDTALETTIDGIFLRDNSACNVHGIKGVITKHDMGAPIIGEEFLKAVKATVRYADGGMYLKCGGSNKEVFSSTKASILPRFLKGKAEDYVIPMVIAVGFVALLVGVSYLISD